MATRLFNYTCRRGMIKKWSQKYNKIKLLRQVVPSLKVERCYLRNMFYKLSYRLQVKAGMVTELFNYTCWRGIIEQRSQKYIEIKKVR